MKFGVPLYAPAMPDWLKKLPSNACLNTLDVMALFGFSNRHIVSGAVASGRFPMPDLSSGAHHKSQWRADTLRIELRRRLAVSTRKA